MQTALAPPKSCCKLYKSSNYLNQCKHFHKFTYDERIKFVNESKLCRSCLESEHFAHNCLGRIHARNPIARAVTPHFCILLKLLHPLILHLPPLLLQLLSLPLHSVLLLAMAMLAPADNRSSLPIVPVKVRLKNSKQSIATQAFLDTGRTSSFITCDLIDKLQVHKTPIVEITTVTINKNKRTRKAKVISNLEISELSEFSYLFHLQPLLSIQCLAASRNDAPTQEDISQFPEFDEIFLPSVNKDVGLLIGNNNRHILKPQSSGVRRIFQWGWVFKSDIKNLFAIYALANKQLSAI